MVVMVERLGVCTNCRGNNNGRDIMATRDVTIFDLIYEFRKSIIETIMITPYVKNYGFLS